MFASSRPTAQTITRQLGVIAAICSAALGLSTASALAAGSPTPATCPGQTFSQVFAAFGDMNEYTLVPGGNFNSSSEGWELSKGARIISTTRPNGSNGGVLDLPSGAVAVSPPVCVTLEYPSARVFVRDVKGSEGVAVGVAYAGTNRTVASPQNVGQVHGQQTSWTPSNPFCVQPQIAGTTEGTREARFVFTAAGKTSEFQLSGVYVDPRMRR
jgi:hypothetical protein